jgi:hypothetical protein
MSRVVDYIEEETVIRFGGRTDAEGNATTRRWRATVGDDSEVFEDWAEAVAFVNQKLRGEA